MDAISNGCGRGDEARAARCRVGLASPSTTLCVSLRVGAARRVRTPGEIPVPR